MMAGLIYHWSGKPSKLTFEIIKKAYRLPDILRWCRRLVRVLAGAKAILIWDRLQAHRSKVVKAFLAAHGVEVVLLPRYAPQLNPSDARRVGPRLTPMPLPGERLRRGWEMHTVSLYADVRRYVQVDRHSQREAARTCGISRDMVAKMLRHSEPPGYQRRKPLHRPTLGPYIGWIDEALKADQARNRKQRHTARRIFERLRDEHG